LVDTTKNPVSLRATCLYPKGFLKLGLGIPLGKDSSCGQDFWLSG
jgi:hypothetical protein